MSVPRALLHRPPLNPILRIRHTPTPAPEAAPEAAPEVEAAPEAPVADFSILSGPITALRVALDSGAYDGVLAELLDAEKTGKNRSTAITAISERMK
jgi:hypothetical protein